MSAPGAHLDVAQAIARHAAPVVGILFLGWSAPGVVLLYFADTLLALAVIMAGVLRHFAPPPQDDGWAARINGEVGAVGFGVVLAAFFAVPLGVPLFFMLEGLDWLAVLADPSLRAGLLWQAVAALWSYAELYREMRHRSPEDLRLKRRFALVFLRWIVLVMIAGTGIGVLFGRFSPLLFVAIYAALSIWSEIAPDRFLRTLPGGAEDATPPPATATFAAGHGKRPKRRSREKRR